MIRGNNNQMRNDIRKQEQGLMSQLLSYWDLMAAGPNEVDIKNKKSVRTVQEILQASGYYNGQIDGKYSPLVDQARWSWVKDIQQDPDFAWELIKNNVSSIFRKEE